MPSRSTLPPGAGLRRSWALLQAFAVEQTDPPRFYATLGEDSVRMIEQHLPLAGRTVLDVGAGPAEFAEAFVEAGAEYVAVDPDPDALTPSGRPGAHALLGDGEALPVRTGAVDVCFCSNVVEHVRNPGRLGDELVRVVRPGGIAVISYTNWLSPWGGHETSPFHYVGGQRAIGIYTRRYGHAPKNRVGVNLFRVTVRDGIEWARRQPDAELVDVRPRYYPGWSRGIVHVPGVREVVTWNLWMVLRRR